MMSTKWMSEVVGVVSRFHEVENTMSNDDDSEISFDMTCSSCSSCSECELDHCDLTTCSCCFEDRCNDNNHGIVDNISDNDFDYAYFNSDFNNDGCSRTDNKNGRGRDKLHSMESPSCNLRYGMSMIEPEPFYGCALITAQEDASGPIDTQIQIQIILQRDENGEFGFSVTGDSSARITTVIEDSMADRAGLISEDQIMRINGRDVSQCSCYIVASIVRESSSAMIIDVSRSEYKTLHDSKVPATRCHDSVHHTKSPRISSHVTNVSSYSTKPRCLNDVISSQSAGSSLAYDFTEPAPRREEDWTSSNLCYADSLSQYRKGRSCELFQNNKVLGQEDGCFYNHDNYSVRHNLTVVNNDENTRHDGRQNDCKPVSRQVDNIYENQLPFHTRIYANVPLSERSLFKEQEHIYESPETVLCAITDSDCFPLRESNNLLQMIDAPGPVAESLLELCKWPRTGCVPARSCLKKREKFGRLREAARRVIRVTGLGSKKVRFNVSLWK